MAPPPDPPAPGAGETRLQHGSPLDLAQTLAIAALLGAGAALAAGMVATPPADQHEIWMPYGLAGLLLGVGLGIASGLVSGEWINLVVLMVVLGVLGLIAGVVRAKFPEHTDLFHLEAAALFTVGACAMRRFENLRELDEYVLRPRAAAGVTVGWGTLWGAMGCADCGPWVWGPESIVVGLALFLGLGLVLGLYRWAARFVGAIIDLGMERMIEEFFLVGAVAVVLTMCFGRFGSAGFMILILLVTFAFYVPRILSLAGLFMYGTAGLAIGLFPAWLDLRPTLGHWVLYGACCGVAIVGEIWVVSVLSFLAAALERNGRPRSALRIYTGLARGLAGRSGEAAMALRAASIALALRRYEQAGALFQSAQRWEEAGEAYLRAARARGVAEGPPVA